LRKELRHEVATSSAREPLAAMLEKMHINKNCMDSKEVFFKMIYKYYEDISIDQIDTNILIELSNRIADYYYEQYNRFGKQYPKSIKRYSEFQLKDLNHPTIFELIIIFFKEKFGDNYSEPSKILLNMTDSRLRDFEMNRELYHNR
jgi:hypothetical protein